MLQLHVIPNGNCEVIKLHLTRTERLTLMVSDIGERHKDCVLEKNEDIFISALQK